MVNSVSCTEDSVEQKKKKILETNNDENWTNLIYK